MNLIIVPSAQFYLIIIHKYLNIYGLAKQKLNLLVLYIFFLGKICERGTNKIYKSDRGAYFGVFLIKVCLLKLFSSREFWVLI